MRDPEHPTLKKTPVEACDCNHLGSSNLVCDYNTGQCPCLPFIAQLGQNNTQSLPADRRCSSCQQNYYGFHSGQGCQLCVCSVSGAVDSQCDDQGVCHCMPTVGGVNCDRCLEGYFSFSENGCLSCNCSTAGSTSHICDFVTGQCSCKVNVQDVKCDACADDSFNLDAENPDGCQKCFCYGHGTSCISAIGYTSHIIHSESILDSNWTDSQPLTSEDNIWLNPIGRTTYDVMYVQAPPLFLGNKMTSYGQALSFDIKILGGKDMLMKGHRFVMMEGNGKKIYYDAANLTVSEDPQRVEIRLREHEWHYNETAQPDYFNMYAILADLDSIHIQRACGSQVLSITDVTLVSSQPAHPESPHVAYVEQCTCEPSRNVDGFSCEVCVDGNQRQTVNGSVYESCKQCDCSARAQTVPAECVPSTGECLNCRNGTTGFHCEECSPHVEGAECDTCMDTFWGLGANGCSPCECDAVGASSPVCDKVTGQCTCKDHVVGRVCHECEDNYYNLQDTGCQECDSCYGLVFSEVVQLRLMRDNLTSFVDMMKLQDNNTVLGPFRDRLTATLNHMHRLLTFLANADAVEGQVTPEVARMERSLRHLQEVLDIDVTSAVFGTNTTLYHAENLLSHCQQVHQETVTTVTDTHTLLTGPIAGMTAEIEAVLSDLQAVESSLSQVSSGAMADATRVLGVVKEIEQQTNDAKTTAETALEHAQSANTIHQNTTRRVAALEQHVYLVTDLSHSVTQEADFLQGNVTSVRDEVVVALLNSTSMEPLPIDSSALQVRAAQLKQEAETLATSASIAERNVESGEVTIIHDVEDAKKVTASLSMRTGQLRTEAESLLTRGSTAHQRGLQAKVNETKVFDDANNMLDVMNNFNKRATDVELQANTSLSLVEQIKGLSEASIQSSLEFQRTLSLTSASAQAAIDTANSSHQMAAQQLEVYKPVYEEAMSIEGSAAPLLNDIEQVAAQVHTATQEDIEPSRITCTGLESQVAAVETRTETGRQKAETVAQNVANTKGRLDAILDDLQNIRELDLGAVDSLQRRVREARADFDQKHLTDALRILREASEEQKMWIEELKKRRDDAARSVRRIRDVQQQLRP